MSPFVPVAFNLLLNTLSSFGLTLGIVTLVLRIIPVRPGRARLTVLLLPFIKVLWDLGRGIPARSFLWVHALGAKQELGSFMLGVGLRPARPPFIHAVLDSRYGGLVYSQSAADLLFRALEKKVSPLAPGLVVSVLLAVAMVRLSAWLHSNVVFRRDARVLLASASLHSRVRVFPRAVSVYSSSAYTGAPYAAGVVHPYVLFSASSLGALDARAREAAIQHELSHVEWHDPLLITCLSIFRSVLWFLPGKDSLTRRVLAEIELCADQRALHRGAEPSALAEAIVSVGEQLYAAPSGALGLARQKPLLRERVERLLGPRQTSRQRVRSWCGQALLILVLVPSVLYSLFFGN